MPSVAIMSAHTPRKIATIRIIPPSLESLEEGFPTSWVSKSGKVAESACAQRNPSLLFSPPLEIYPSTHLAADSDRRQTNNVTSQAEKSPPHKDAPGQYFD